MNLLSWFKHRILDTLFFTRFIINKRAKPIRDKRIEEWIKLIEIMKTFEFCTVMKKRWELFKDLTVYLFNEDGQYLLRFLLLVWLTALNIDKFAFTQRERNYLKRHFNSCGLSELAKNIT